MKDDYIIVEVAVPIPVFETYIYRLKKSKTENLPDKELIGRRVLVPLKKTKTVGIITDVKEISDIDKFDFEIKDIEEIPDRYPIYSKEYIEILKELSEFYLSPIGLTLYYGMPDSLRWKYIKSKNRWEKIGFNNYIIYTTVNITDSYKLPKRQKELLEYVISVGETSYEDLTEIGFSPITIKSLINKGLLKKENLYFLEETEQFRLKQNIKPFGKEFLKKGIFLYSSERIEKRLENYVNLIANSIYEGKSSLIIFPNVATLKKAYKFLKPIFEDKLYIYFDGLKSKEKIKTWFNLKNLSGLVCIGTFSSIFIPIKNLSLLVIEEEHSNSYKLMRVPRFDIRNFGYKLYKNKKNLTFILASSTPSVETVYLKEKGLAKSFKENRDLLKSIKSKIIIESFNYSEIDEKLKYLLKDKDNILLLANRKGYSSILYCEVCQTEITCERCDIPLKVHINPKRLECPLCNTKYEFINNCIHCGNRLSQFGFGVEKLERELKKIFPDKRIRVETTIIDKELLFDKYETVVNIFPDIFLRKADFKADEKFFRAVVYPYIKSTKNYILITNKREHIGIKSLINKSIELFYKNELDRRKILNYPPFKQFILLSFEGKELKKSHVEKLFKDWLEKFNIKDIDYEGVFFAYYPYLREKFRYQIILKDFKEKFLLKELFNMATKRAIKLIIDVSPKEIK